MDYDKDIILILAEAGQKGLRAGKIALHVYNTNRSLFFSPEKNDVYKRVLNCLHKRSSTKKPLITKGEKRGYYRLTPRGKAEAARLTTSSKAGDTTKDPDKTERGTPVTDFFGTPFPSE